MPTYEYGCSNCGIEWEKEQPITEEATKDCPVCGKPTAKRLISRSGGFSLKGRGWAADNYGSSRSK